MDIDVDSYVTIQLRAHGRVADSPSGTGARVGARCYVLVYGFFYLLPACYSWSSTRMSWRFMEDTIWMLIPSLFWGAIFGALVFLAYSKTVTRRQCTFDGAIVGYHVGFLFGALLGAASVRFLKRNDGGRFR